MNGQSQDHEPTVTAVTSGQYHTPLGDLELICGDVFDRWDKDMRSGKLLTALSGHMSPGYDPRVDRVREALASAPRLQRDRDALLEALKGIVDESAFNQLRYQDEDDTDYFLRCFRAVKDRARAAITAAEEAKP